MAKVKIFLDKNEKKYYLNQILDNLNNFRKKGNYILNDKTYDCIINLLNLLLEKIDNNDKYLYEIIKFSQAFYKIKENEINPKYFILYSLCNNSIFTKSETWHKIINYSLNNELRDKNLFKNLDKIEKDKKLNEYAFKVIIENLSILKVIKINDKTYNDAKNYYSNVYKIPEEILNEEITKFMKENQYFISKKNENQIIKGEDSRILINEINQENKKDISNDIKDNNINKENNN